MSSSLARARKPIRFSTRALLMMSPKVIALGTCTEIVLCLRTSVHLVCQVVKAGLPLLGIFDLIGSCSCSQSVTTDGPRPVLREPYFRAADEGVASALGALLSETPAGVYAT